MIFTCKCENAWQDARYGKGLRVHNYKRGISEKTKVPHWTCTVCGEVKQGPQPKDKEK